MRAVACFYARENGFFQLATTNDQTSTGCVPANDRWSATLTINYPPRGAMAGAFSGRSGYVQVIISGQHESFFGSVLGQGTATVTTGAVAAMTDGNANGNSLVALDPTDCAAAKIAGTSKGTGLKVGVGGYVQVNSSCGGVLNPHQITTCGGGPSGLQVSGSSNANLTAPRIFTTGTCQANGGASLTSTDWGSTSHLADQGVLPIGDPLSGLLPPTIDYTAPGARCGPAGIITDALVNNNGCSFSGSGSINLQPGVYYGGWSISGHVTINLAPGVYIIAGGGIGQSAQSTLDSVSGNVLIYSTDNPAPQYLNACMATWTASKQCQGSLDVTGQATIDMSGVTSGPYKGLLIWQDGHGSCPTWTPSNQSCFVHVGGGSSVQLSGTIYAPDQQVFLAGGSYTTVPAQIISWAWDIQGNAPLNMPYDPNSLYHLDNKGLVN
jgi:hypothetical protein